MTKRPAGLNLKVQLVSPYGKFLDNGTRFGKNLFFILGFFINIVLNGVGLIHKTDGRASH